MEIAGVKCETNGKTMIVTIDGDIDHHSAGYIRDQIDTAIFYCRPSEMIMDLSGVTFMDSSGLGLILGRYAKVAGVGGRMIIQSPTPQTVKILDLAGVTKLLEIRQVSEKVSK